MFLEEHNVLRSMRSGFCVYDSRGVDLNRMREGLPSSFFSFKQRGEFGWGFESVDF